MTIYFNPMSANQTSVSGTALQTQGNGQANHSTTSPYTVPEGANYVSVWSTATYTVSATPLANGATAGVTSAWPANAVTEVPNVIPGKTVITVTEI